MVYFVKIEKVISVKTGGFFITLFLLSVTFLYFGPLNLGSHKEMNLFNMINESLELDEEFTKLEESVLLSIQFNQTLLATGGSAVLCDAAMQFMKKESEVIFLDVSYENISQRITNLSERGLVRNPNQSLQEAYNERISLYKKYADHVVVNNGDIESCLKDLVTLTEEF